MEKCFDLYKILYNFFYNFMLKNYLARLSCKISVNYSALILFIQTLALYKSFTYLLTYLLN